MSPQLTCPYAIRNCGVSKSSKSMAPYVANWNLKACLFGM